MDELTMLELFQTEWCPASRRVRQRLTELGIDFVNRQVPVERDARNVLRAAVGSDTIPALWLENGSAVVGEENILTILDERFVEPREAEAHRLKAAEIASTALTSTSSDSDARAQLAVGMIPPQWGHAHDRRAPDRRAPDHAA